MRALRISAATALVLLAIGVRSRAGENDVRAECSFNARAFRSAAMTFHELSERAELVAPSMHAAALAAATMASSRNHAAVPPAQPPLTFTAKNFIDDEIF